MVLMECWFVVFLCGVVVLVVGCWGVCIVMLCVVIM